MREDGNFIVDGGIDAEIFRAYDIRGVVGITLTEHAVYQIGRAFAAESLAARARVMSRSVATGVVPRIRSAVCCTVR